MVKKWGTLTLIEGGEGPVAPSGQICVPIEHVHGGFLESSGEIQPF